MGFTAFKKAATPQDLEAARQSTALLNKALDERFGHLPNIQVIPWISDIHMHDDEEYDTLPHYYVDEIDTGRQFVLAMEEVKALQADVPLLVLGGDITDYSRPGEWRRFKRLLTESGWSKPVVPALGNHDNRNQKYDPALVEALRANWNEIKLPDWPAVSDPGELFYSVKHNGLTYIVLDTMVTNQYRLSEQQKSWLLAELAKLDGPAVVICHRHFLNVGNWVDELLAVRDFDLWKMLDANPHILGVFSGHVHYTRLWDYRRKLYATFPSLAHGIGVGTGWGGFVLHENQVAAVFWKEVCGEGYEYYKGLQDQRGEFVFMTPEPFESSLLCSKSWPREKTPKRKL